MTAPADQPAAGLDPYHLGRVVLQRVGAALHVLVRTKRRIALLLLAVLLIAPPLAVAPVVLPAIQLYRTTSAGFDARAGELSALANYGGAQIYDRNGALLYRFPAPSGGIRLPVRLEGVSPRMVEATVSTEDANFWESGGIDIRGTIAAAYENFRAGGNPLAGRGGSGITQQLVKQTLIPASERSEPAVSRKIREAAYAVAVAGRYDRAQIMEWYLNAINYGGVYDGIESAAQGYFGVPARDLTLAQSAMLAGIPQSPAQYSPYLHPERAKERQVEVLNLMVRHGSITAEEAAAAEREPLNFQNREISLPIRAPWFVEYVRQELINRFGEKCVQTCGLSVTTTLDLTLQDNARTLLDENLTKYADPIGAHNGALVSIDARSGEVLVMVGGRDYYDANPKVQGSNNFATAILQPGSSFKPFVYLTLFVKKGYGPQSIIWDAPFTTSDGYACENPGVTAKNSGPVPVNLALGSSLNCAANRAAATAGIANVIDLAHSMGITTLEDPRVYGPSIATGGANISLLDMTYAYTTLARNGSMIGTPASSGSKRALDVVALRDVTDGTGRVLFHYDPQTQQVVPAADAYMVTSITSDCQTRRLIWACGFPLFELADHRAMASKTGTQQGETTKETQASWQFSYTPEIVTGGWVGNADRSTWTDRNGAANAVGYSVQQLEQAIVKQYDIPPSSFTRPSDVVEASVHVPDGSLGLLGGCGPVQKGLFMRGTQPDVNNRVCINGVLTVPAEQLGTGGLTFQPLPANNLATEIARIISPLAGAEVHGGFPILVRGVAGVKLSVEWGTGATPTSWSALPLAVVGGDSYAAWDTRGLADGAYALRVLADGVATMTITVNVKNTAGTPVPSATPTPKPSVTPGATASPVPTPTPRSTASATPTPIATPPKPR